MPVRKIPPSRRAITGRLTALKSSGPADYESALERDFLITLEADPDVVSYEVQPMRLTYWDSGGRERHYTPDVLVSRRNDVTELCEVKYTTDIQELRAQHRERWIAAHQHAQQRGWRFRLITEHHARTDRTRNWLFLSAFRLLNAHPAHLSPLLTSAQAHGPLSIAAWLEHHPEPPGELLPFVWHLVCTGEVTVDLDRPLSLATVVHAPVEETHA
ncbi:TnsA endonuclease N-terminal domain-containing protein [Deinococcus yunweiensis]|uniref:TnsA endonuclease N-terminal domain-containing protein n=1 Tax=Deinococcus yunweiensis TaxID=367282 RepID=UPI00398F5AD6